jgi:hypothetical protein
MLRQCLQMTPFDPSVARRTLAALQQTLPLYVYLDDAAAAGADLLQQLRALGGGSFSNDFAFHSRVAHILRAVGDAALAYYPPLFYRQLAAFLPWRLEGATVRARRC